MNAKQRRQQREAKQAELTPSQPPVALKVGDWQFRVFNGLDAAFGASDTDYPPYDSIPDQFRRGHTKLNDVVSALFFKGGTLEDHGLRLKAGIDTRSAYTTLRSLLCSFAPKHELKEATVAWALSEWTELASSNQEQAA